MKKKILVLLSMILITIISFTGCISQKETVTQVCEICSDSLKDKAVLFLMFVSWGEVIDSPSEYGFKTELINFGDVEAKNVNITCTANSNDKTIYKTTEQTGNHASHSYEVKDVYVTPEVVIDPNASGFCWISGCDNCIILNNEIPILKELQE